MRLKRENVALFGPGKEIGPLFGLGSAYAEEGQRSHNRAYMEKAKSIFEKIYQSEQKHFLLEDLPHFYQNFAILYWNLGLFEDAFDMQKEVTAIRDSLYQKGNLQWSQKLEVQYRVAEKDKQLAAQKLKISRQNTWIVGVAGSALFLLALMIGLLWRKKHKEELARLKAILMGEEQERNRMARELHDGVLSQLSAVKLNFATLPQFPDKNEEDRFQEAMRQLEYSILELRTTSHNLYSGILQQEGLGRATRIFCEKISSLTAVDIDFQLIGTLPVLDAYFQLELYRMIQELVQNIIKHAQATHALVQIACREDWIGITIDDNGIGMSRGQLKDNGGIGLDQLRQRVRSLQGTFAIESAQGTSIYLEFNLKQKK